MKALLAAAGSGILALVFLILSCVDGGHWWPLFNVGFMIFIPLPYVLGSHESTGLLGSFGDFLESILMLCTFAFPTVLHHLDQMNLFGLFLCYVSNVLAGGSLFLTFKISQESSIW